MGRYIGPVCRLCRREGEKLFLKGERCYTSKCAIEKRNFGPGQHGKGRQQFSQYKIQLREKQKVKRIYGVSENTMRIYFGEASKSKEVTGTVLLQRLESRLDNMVYRLGFTVSRTQGRQLVAHGNVMVNGKVITVASYRTKVGDSIEVTESARKHLAVVSALESSKSRVIPEWLLLDRDAVKGTVNALPTREQMYQNIKDQLIVELYSK